jgi:ABC-2 type transport system permease protein
MKNYFRGLSAVAYKESIHMRRDFATIVFSLLIPLMQMTILGFGIDTNVRQIRTVVFDQQSDASSRAFLDRLSNSDTFKIIQFVHTDAEMNELIVAGKARVGVKIPWDFSQHILRGQPTQVLVLVDGSDSSVSGQAVNVVTSIGLDESLQRVLAPGQKLIIDVRPQLLFNPDSRSPNFLLPGMSAVLLLSVTTFLTAFSIVREKEKGTLDQLMITPMEPLGLLMGKILPYLAVGFFELCLILTAMRFAFRIPIHGSVPLMLLLSIPYLFVSLSLGTLVSTRANSQAEAMQLAFIAFMPSIFFSGYIFPRETMPLPFYLLSFLVPATYFVDIARGVILRGAGLRQLWIDAVVLFGMGTVMLLAGARAFTRRIANK